MKSEEEIEINGLSLRRKTIERIRVIHWSYKNLRIEHVNTQIGCSL